MISVTRQSDLASLAAGQTTACEHARQAPEIGARHGAERWHARTLRTANDIRQLFDRFNSAGEPQDGRAEEPQGDGDDARALQRMLQEGGQIKRLAEDVRKSRVAAQPAPPSATRLKRNPVSVALAALILSHQTGARSGSFTAGSMHAEARPPMPQADTDCAASQFAERAMLKSGNSGGPPHLDEGPASPIRLSRSATSVARDHIEFAAGQIEKDFATRFPALYKGYDGFAEFMRFSIELAMFQNEESREVDADTAKAFLSLTILSVADFDLCSISRQNIGPAQIEVLTCLRLMCYASLHTDIHSANFSAYVYSELLNKSTVSTEFVLENIISLLSGGSPKSIYSVVTAHFEAIKTNISSFRLGEIEESNFHLLSHELDRTLRMLQDPKYLSGEVAQADFEKLKRDLGPAVIKRVAVLERAYRAGVPPGALLRGVMALNREIEAGDVSVADLTVPPDDLEIPPLPDAQPCPTGGDSCASAPNGLGAILEPQAVSMEEVETFANRTLARTAELYSSILEPRVFIDMKLREGISKYRKLTGATFRVTPTTTLAVTLSPKIVRLGIPPQRHFAKPIQRYYTVSAIVTKAYLYDIEKLRDADGRGYVLTSRSMESLLAHLEKIDLQGEMEEALKSYRADPKIAEGRRYLIQSLMILRCLQYLENSDDSKTIAAVEEFLLGKRQAMSVRFHDVPVSGVFYIPTAKYEGIAFSLNDPVFHLARPGVKPHPGERGLSEVKLFLDFGESEEFRKWILQKIPYYDQLRFGAAVGPFRCKVMYAHVPGSRRQMFLYSPFSFTPSSDRGELVNRLNRDEMDRLASDIDTLVFSPSEQRLQEWLPRAKIFAQVASFGTGVAAFGAGSVIGGACLMGASLGFSLLDAAASLALARSADRPDVAQGHYQDAVVGAALTTLLAAFPVKNIGVRVHKSLVTIENVDYAMRCLRVVRNGVPDLTRRMRMQRALPGVRPGGVVNAPKVVASRSKASAAGTGSLPGSVGGLSTISKKPFETRAGVRMLEEIQRNHIDGVVMSTYRIDMENFYVYTLAPAGSLPDFAGKRLVFSAHGAYTGDGVRVEDLVPVPRDLTVSYLTPAGLALDSPALLRTMSYAEVKPFMEATQQSVKIAAGAAGKYGTPFDAFAHSILTSDLKFREQYFSNFPYENEAEITRALVRNYKDSKVSGKLSDVAVVKLGKALLLSELLRDQLGYSEILLSSCRVFAVPGTTDVRMLSPEISRQVYLIMKRAYDYGDNVPARVVKANLGAPELSETTYQAMIGAHDAIAELSTAERPSLVYETGTRRYSFYELLRLYSVKQNQ